MHGVERPHPVGDIPDDQVYGLSKELQKGLQNVGASSFDN